MGRLWDLLTGGGPPAGAQRGQHDAHDLHLAAAALLIEVAMVDQTFDAAELKRIRRYAATRLGLSEAETEALIDVAERKAADATQLHRFTQLIKNGLSYEERLTLVETLWEVIFADGHADAYEQQMMRRIAGLIYVTDRDSGLARRRASERIARERRLSQGGGAG